MISGITYNNTLSGNGGQGPYSFALSPGSPPLPPGLTLASNGTLSGTPTAVGSFDFLVRMTDSASRFADRAYTIIINP